MNDAVGSDARNAGSSSPVLPIVGIAIAIAGTTTMDATGLSDFSAFALLPLMLLFLYLEGLSRSEMGFRWGRPAHFVLALLYPLVVIGAIRHRGDVCRRCRSLENELAESTSESFDRDDLDRLSCDHYRRRIFQGMTLGIPAA
jgi:hypothetical protein